MSNGSEEEARRRKILLDAEIASLATRNIGPVMSGRLSIDQVETMIALDEAWLRDTKACMARGGSDTA